MQIREGNIVCSEDESLNILEYGSRFYRIEPLNDPKDLEGGKGGNSNVFKLIDPNLETPETELQEFEIIKFCKYSVDDPDPKIQTRIERFKNEVRALKKAKEYGVLHIIQYHFNEAIQIDGKDYLYYAMEKGEGDLLDFMIKEQIDDQQKYVLCKEVVRGIKELHDLDIYHRDIKPDNIFFVKKSWKIGDLGLMDERDRDQNLDTIREKIGPSGWLSPEAVNKMLCEGTSLERVHCCSIKDYSDVFQLGKLVWYVFEGTAPIGQVNLNNFRLNNPKIFDLLIRMLQHNKDDRPSIDETLAVLEGEARNFNA